MKKTIFISVLFIAFCLASAEIASAKTSPYVLSVADTTRENFVRVVLKNKSSGRTLWARTIPGNYRQSYWSADYRAVAVETSDIMLVWRKGHRLINVAYPQGHKLGSAEGFDYSMGYVWSPDKQRLLVRFGASGMADMNYGELYSLKFKKRTYVYASAPNHVGKMIWRDNRTALCWYYDAPKLTHHKKPRLWRVP